MEMEAGFVAGAGGGSGVRRWRRQVQGFLSGDESVLILIAVMNAQLCEHTKSRVLNSLIESHIFNG